MTIAAAPNPFALAAAQFEDVEHWQPQPKQALATELAGYVDELLYGGAAGGGKTEWLIQYAAAVCERWPNVRAVIFRRVFPSLARSVIPRAQAALANRAKWNANSHTFTFPNGSVLELASLQHAHSVHDYQGAEYVLICWEELTEFLQSQYEYMIGRLRSAVPGVRPHSVATTNPGGKGHKWVKRRFIRPAVEDLADPDKPPTPGEAWTPRPTSDNPDPGSRCFLPATLADNPRLLEADPGYRNRLRANSNRALRKALEDGDWDAIDAIEGALWQETWIRWVPPERLAEIATAVSYTVVGIDPAAKDKVTSDENGIVVMSRGTVWNAGVQSPRLWVRADRSKRTSPGDWGRIACLAFLEFDADAFVAEDNQGGDMVEFVIRQSWEQLEREGKTGRRMPPRIERVTSRVGKAIRAEPVAQMYEDGLVEHVGDLPELEEQLLTWIPEDGDSPDRLDAMVHAAHYLRHPTKTETRTQRGSRWSGRSAYR